MAGGLEAGRVGAARYLSPGFRALTIAAESPAGLAFEPGADVAVRLPLADGSADERRYSVWKSSAAAGTFDVCVVQHGLGPGSRWAGQCAVGDRVEFAPSRALPIALDRSAETHLFIGDETSVASAEALIRALPAQARVHAWFEVASSDYRWPASELLRPDAVDWVARDGRPGAGLVARLARETLPPASGTTMYVTGEAWLCAMIHAHVVRQRGVPPAAVRAMPYWKARTRPA
jgi:NADPH-dependent ferric siderophore reductase